MKKGNRKRPFRFAVAFSFPGEYREYVRKVDQALCKKWLSPKKVFFDERFEAEIVGFDADTLLQNIYHDQSELIVVFLCKEFEQKEWCCNVEWRAIRDLIKKRRGPSVLPLGFDAVKIPGVYSIDIIADISNRTPEETAQLIWNRLQFLRGITPDHPPTPPLGVLHNVPPMPSQFLERPSVFNQIKKTLLTSLQPGDTKAVGLIGASKVGVHGMGGVGKTILAAAIAQDEDIRRAFPDGIYWLTIGFDSGNDQIATRQRQLANSLDASSPSFNDIQGGKAVLEELLRNKACLVILDDVWKPKHADAFNALGPKGRLLITTRIGEVLSDNRAETILVDVLNDDEAETLLAKWACQSREELPTSTFYVARECGYLPLALSMVGAMVRMRQDKTDVWQDVLDQLKSRDLEDFRSHFPDYQYPHLLRAITVSLDDLGAEYKEHYLDFAIFPEDQAVPKSVFLTLWGKIRNMAGRKVRVLLDQLVDRSLARRDEKGRIYLHDLQSDYVHEAVSQESGGLAARHNLLLEAYSVVCGAANWAKGPDDGYYFQWLPWHLRQAGREEELHRLLWEPEWYRAKLRSTDVYALILDLAMCKEDKPLRIVGDALYLSTYALSHDQTQLASQLVGRLISFEEPPIQLLVQKIAASQDGLWLRPLAPTLTPPGGSLLRTLEGHTDRVNAVAVTSDGKVVSGSEDKTLKVWDIKSGRLLRTLKGDTSMVRAITVTSDGKVVSGSGYDSTLKVWDIESGRLLRALKGDKDIVSAITVTSDGKVVSESKDKTLKVRDMETGRLLRTLKGHTDDINAVAVTSDGKVVSGSEDKTLKVWDIKSGRLLRTLEGDTKIRAITVTSDGKVVSGSSDHTLEVWDMETGRLLRTLKGHTGDINAVAVTSDGRVVSGSKDKTLKIWDIESGGHLHTFKGYSEHVSNVAITFDGRKMVSGSSIDSTLKVWEMESGRLLRTLEGDTMIGLTTVTSDGKVVSGSWDKTLKVWDIESGKLLRTLEGHTSMVRAITVTSDGKVVSGSSDHTLKVWDMDSGKLLHTLEGHTGSVVAIAVTSDEKVVSVSDDKTLKIWDIKSGRLLRTLKGDTNIGVITVTSDGKVVSGSFDHTLKVWDIESGKLLRTLEGHTSMVRAITVTSDGKVVSGSSDHTLKVWDMESGRLLRTLEGYTGGGVVAIIPYGKVAFGSWDNTLKVWDIESDKVLASFTTDAVMTTCAVASDGRTIVAGDFGGLLPPLDGHVHFLRLEGLPTVKANKP